jgi:hypothetical protein
MKHCWLNWLEIMSISITGRINSITTLVPNRKHGARYPNSWITQVNTGQYSVCQYVNYCLVITKIHINYSKYYCELKSSLFWGKPLCNAVDIKWYHQGRLDNGGGMFWSFELTHKKFFSEKVVDFHQTTVCYIAEKGILHSSGSANPNSA